MSIKAFTGKIVSFNQKGKGRRSTLLTFEMSIFTSELCDTFMCNFNDLKLSEKEKKDLSRERRMIIDQYKKISPFSLNKDKNELIEAINSNKKETITIEASEYGAYICLAAAYSGKIDADKKIKFIISSSPIALFPKSFIKNHLLSENIEIVYSVKSEHWLDCFETLYHNDFLKYSLQAA